MDSNQKDFLISEFNTAWDMILAIDSRRGTFSRYYNILFLAVLSVSTNILVNIEKLNFVICVGLTVVFAFTYLVGNTTKGVLESERAANVRYRKKVNLIREIFLGKSEEEIIKHYLSHTELGIKLLSQESEQPEGISRTLDSIYQLIFIQKVALIICAIGLWCYYFTTICLNK